MSHFPVYKMTTKSENKSQPFFVAQKNIVVKVTEIAHTLTLHSTPPRVNPMVTTTAIRACQPPQTMMLLLIMLHKCVGKAIP